MLSPDGRLLFLGSSTGQPTPAGELLMGLYLWDMPGVAGDPAAKVALQSGVEKASRGEIVRVETALGRKREILLRPLWSVHGQVQFIILETRDLPERLEAAVEPKAEDKQQEALRRLNRLYAVSNATSEAVFRIRNIDLLFQQVCRIVVEKGGFALAWIGRNENGSILPVTFCGRDDGYVRLITRSEKGVASGKGPTGRALRTGRSAISNDIVNDVGIHFRQEAADRSFRSCGAFPLRPCGITQAVLTVYSDVPNFFEEEEVALLNRMADNLTLAMETAEAEFRLRDQAEWLDQARDAIRVCDLEGRVIYWNRSCGRLFGWSDAEVAGRHYRELFPAQTDHLEELAGIVMDTAAWTGEVSLGTKHGAIVTLESRWTLLRDSLGAPRGILIIDTDVTEKKKLETQFLRAQRVESVGTLAGGIAHDLNNILSPILMSVQLLRVKLEDPLDATLLQTMEESAKRGAEMVRQILMFARGFEGPRQPVAPAALFRDLRLLVRDTFPKSISTHIEMDPRADPVLGDSTQIGQVLLNLCVNARDAMPSGGSLEVTASTSWVEAVPGFSSGDLGPGRYTVFMVKDTGIGMTESIQKRMFEPFFTTKQQGNGTGLGLSTSLAIVRNHGGCIGVQSEVGRGTVFCVYLPALGSSEKQSENPAPLEIPRGRGETILVIDDEASIRLIMRQILSAFGYRVLAAADGEAALLLYRQHTEEISLVVTDMMMPGMDGTALVDALAKINPRVRVVAASGLPSASTNYPPLVKQFLQKPFAADKFLQIVRQAIDAD